MRCASELLTPQPVGTLKTPLHSLYRFCLVEQGLTAELAEGIGILLMRVLINNYIKI